MRSLTSGTSASIALPRDAGSAHYAPLGAPSFADGGLRGPFAWLAAKPPRGLGGALAATLLCSVAAFGFFYGGRYGAVVSDVGGVGNFLARAAGFGVERVVINGLSELGGRDALISAGVGKNASLPFFDVDAARAKLEALPLVQSASVRKLYPDQVVIDIVERTPTAIWQRDGELHTIGADGAVIDELKNPRYAELPFVVGAGANKRLAQYKAITAALEELAAKGHAGVLVDGRRWDLQMTSGVAVKLPEEAPEAAAAELVRLQRQYHLLDRDMVALDLRASDRIFVKLAEGAALPDRDPKPKKGAQP